MNKKENGEFKPGRFQDLICIVLAAEQWNQ